MSRRNLFTALFVIVCLSGIRAANADCRSDYIVPGREALFEDSFSGLRQAYQILETGKQNPICSGDRELVFLHALARMAMWGVRDDGGEIDSALEFAREFGIIVSGDYYLQLDINLPDYPAASYGSYEMPVETPQADEIKTHIFDELLPAFADFVGDSAIPEIEAVIAELNSITETQSDRFRIFFYPEETGLQGNLEVDYADVLVLKGALYLLKGQLETRTAYDISTDANDIIIEKFLSGGLVIEDDLLTRYPNLLKVLPTPGHPEDGSAILAQARQDLINGIDSYHSAVNYMLSEDDPQDDDLLSVDPRLYEAKDKIDDELLAVRDSLAAGTAITHTTTATETYSVEDSTSTRVGTLILKYDAVGRLSAGIFLFNDIPGSWDVKDVTIDDFGFIAEMELNGGWGSAVLAGTISTDHRKISNAAFEYWGSYEGNVTGLTANRLSSETEDVQVNLNPIYGPSPGHTVPVNPRDILPEFDSWNEPMPETFGRGLSYDATLGGILPQFTQDDWRSFLNLQPGGLFYLQEVIYPWQKRYYNGQWFVSIWMPNQLVFTDPAQDTDENSDVIDNVDIASLYMGYDDDALYGTIFSYDFSQNSDYTTEYELYLSYSHDDTDTLDSIRLLISFTGESGYGQIQQLIDYGDYTYWENLGSFPVHVGLGGVDLRVPWSSMPGFLPGRFICLNSSGYNYDWGIDDGERNSTNLQIGEVGRIRGTVACDSATYKGAPIFIQAYTDPGNRDETVVASAVIEQPGPYQLDGIGLGWNGWVRASMPCHQFDACGVDVWQVEDVTSVFVGGVDTPNINLTLGACTIPCEHAERIYVDVTREGLASANSEIWYYFIADENAVFSVECYDIEGSITVFDRCGGNELMRGYPWDLLRFNAHQGQTYYIRLLHGGEDNRNYTITVSNYGPAITNDRCDTATETVTDVNYEGTTEGALCDGQSICGGDDDYDVWFKFTPPADGVYEVNLVNNPYDSTTIAIYDDCDGNEVKCQRLWWTNNSAYLNCTAGRTYYIRFAYDWSWMAPYTLRISYFAEPLPNDACADAVEILEEETVEGTTTGALDNDVWYWFTPANSGVYYINLDGYYYGFDVLDDCDGNDVPMGNTWPQYFKTEAGKPYLIEIKGEGGGNFTLQLSYNDLETSPANDDKENAEPIEAGSSYSGTTNWATKDGDTVCDGSSTDVWYSFTPIKSGIYRLGFEIWDFDVTLAVLEPGLLGWTDDLDELTCNDSYGYGPSYFYARAGYTCYIRIAGRWNDAGTFTFGLNEISFKSLAEDLTGDSVVDLLDLQRFCSYWLSGCPQPYWCDGADFNENSAIEFADFAVLANLWLEAGP